MSEDPRLAITMGDPAGIGSEVIVKSVSETNEVADTVVVGDADVIGDAIRVCEVDLRVNVVDDVSAARFERGVIDVLDLDNVDSLVYGELRKEYGAASLEYVSTAIELAQKGAVDGIVTAPIHKQATKRAGSNYAGHTGMLADYTDTETYSMMLIEDELIVTHVSTHVPLSAACELVTEENVLETIRVTARGLMDLGYDDPDIAVAGLNPHASDGGLLGDADLEEIEPAVERARDEGINVEGPLSADTVYVQAAQGSYDCVVSMYHDEGHIPIKMLAFSTGSEVSGVNMTVGLPIVRTSVDHGTAFDIAGEGVASPQSLVDAVDVAVTAVQNRTGSRSERQR